MFWLRQQPEQTTISLVSGAQNEYFAVLLIQSLVFKSVLALFANRIKNNFDSQVLMLLNESWRQYKTLTSNTAKTVHNMCLLTSVMD
jgi:hypothetical protein